MRLLIVVDKLNDELRRIIEFLAEASASQLQVVGCGLNLFESAAGRILVPELCGVRTPTVAPSRRGMLRRGNSRRADTMMASSIIMTS